MRLKVGDTVKHEDAAFSEDFRVVSKCENKKGFYMIQGPKPKYSESFIVARKKLIKTK
ncbi:hypothetical protein ACUXCC_002624 [Cytobacillus horneckiae]|uniref:hypothetical protein n=1 Tax=Cytobacillus horneckiae TaxID=549687 RepID=UPI0019D1F035|nr:hypothetical protein [Cytobacillus horneckiae]MBN6887484.1 hypothetical protein [Cytobacillus horneckiae]